MISLRSPSAHAGHCAGKNKEERIAPISLLDARVDPHHGKDPQPHRVHQEHGPVVQPSKSAGGPEAAKYMIPKTRQDTRTATVA